MTIHYKDFPFEEIRDKPDGDYFLTAQECHERTGYGFEHIWSVTEGDDNEYVYGPSQHYINKIGYVATEEVHDNDTYYIEKF
jgi:hypothetical protein